MIDALLASREGSTIEFKQQLPANNFESKQKIFETVAAFANCQGGNLVFGVESDEATVSGVEVSDRVKECERLSQLAIDLVTPTPDVGVRSHDIAGSLPRPRGSEDDPWRSKRRYIERRIRYWAVPDPPVPGRRVAAVYDDNRLRRALQDR